MFRNEQNNRLKPDAVPTLFEVVSEEQIEVQTSRNYYDHNYANDSTPPCPTSPGMI